VNFGDDGSALPHRRRNTLGGTRPNAADGETARPGVSSGKTVRELVASPGLTAPVTTKPFLSTGRSDQASPRWDPRSLHPRQRHDFEDFYPCARNSQMRMVFAE
jgi:hypothetical protein